MTLAILQARMSSNRLPGKALEPLHGEPMLGRQLERVQRARNIDQLVVATSVDASDDPLADYVLRRGVDVFRGELDDVLDRFYHAACTYGAEDIVRLTGDCPLADPTLIDQIIELYRQGGYDIVTNTVAFTYPDGLDAWAFSFDALEQAWREAELPSHREHVTLFMQWNPRRFRVGSVESGRDLSALRWTVDEPGDLRFMEAVYGALYDAKPDFSTDDVLALLARQPELADINAHYVRNEGLQRSLEEDEAWRRRHGQPPRGN